MTNQSQVASASIVKIDDDKRLVFGWASIIKDESGRILLDRQDDFIDSEDELEKAAYDYVLHSRDGGEMHVRRGVAKMVESVVFTEEKQRALGIPVGSMPTGWWIGFKVDDSRVWEQVKKGEYAGFSVHGTGKRESTELPIEKVTEIGKADTKKKRAKMKKVDIAEIVAKTEELKKGDYPGHPFRGNQHTGKKSGRKGRPPAGGMPKQTQRAKERQRAKARAENDARRSKMKPTERHAEDWGLGEKETKIYTSMPSYKSRAYRTAVNRHENTRGPVPPQAVHAIGMKAARAAKRPPMKRG